MVRGNANRLWTAQEPTEESSNAKKQISHYFLNTRRDLQIASVLANKDVHIIITFFGTWWSPHVLRALLVKRFVSEMSAGNQARRKRNSNLHQQSFKNSLFPWIWKEINQLKRVKISLSPWSPLPLGMDWLNSGIKLSMGKLLTAWWKSRRLKFCPGLYTIFSCWNTLIRKWKE